MASRKSEKKGGGSPAGAVGPDPATAAENRLAEALDHVAQRLLNEAPTKVGLASATLTALCEVHPMYQEGAKLTRLQLEERKLELAIKALEVRKEEALKTGPGKRALQKAEEAAKAAAEG